MMKYEWVDKPPERDGDFFYDGLLPNETKRIVGIVQISTHPASGARFACIFIPPGWRGDADIHSPVVYYGLLRDWTGRWSGPPDGLCCVTM